jgi:hypothetical protein
VNFLRTELGSRNVLLTRNVWAVVMPGGAAVIILHLPDTEAHIYPNGEYYIVIDSKSFARQFMEKDEALTREIQDYFLEYARRNPPGYTPDSITYLEHWIRPHAAWVFGKEPVVPGGRREWEFGEYESGNTANWAEDIWLGDVYSFIHFRTPDVDGAIIRWHRGGDIRGNYSDPEVWFGDFHAFMSNQEDEDWWTPAGFLKWNDFFENGFMWALDRLGSFDGDITLEKTVYKAIEEDPSVAAPPIDRKILENEKAFPPEVVRAVREHFLRTRG